MEGINHLERFCFNINIVATNAFSQPKSITHSLSFSGHNIGNTLYFRPTSSWKLTLGITDNTYTNLLYICANNIY
jgi:hypothetical protein